MTLRCKDIVLSIVRHTTGIEQIADCFFCTVISHFVGNKVAELNGRIGKRECDGLRLILLGLSIQIAIHQHFRINDILSDILGCVRSNAYQVLFLGMCGGKSRLYRVNPFTILEI